MTLSTLTLLEFCQEYGVQPWLRPTRKPPRRRAHPYIWDVWLSQLRSALQTLHFHFLFHESGIMVSQALGSIADELEISPRLALEEAAPAWRADGRPRAARAQRPRQSLKQGAAQARA
ncbi:MAG: hypothetical protein OXU25_01365 [Thaumarchaeota archaeon]|nr:hypothetical protein [Nitrososphaerota archaeon]